jgi:hypothetical protein
VIARGDIRILIFSELAWNIVYVGSAVIAGKAVHSLEAIGVCYLASYIGYLAYFVYYIHKRYPHVLGNNELAMTLVGTFIVVIASIVLWNRTTVNWDALLVCICAALSSWFVLSSGERIKIRHAIRVRLPVW